MNVVMINGSPRAKGNSNLLCDEFARGARESDHTVEKISLREHTVNPCKACYACFQTGKCVQKDDMASILAKVKQAEVLGTKAMDEAYQAGKKLGNSRRMGI